MVETSEIQLENFLEKKSISLSLSDISSNIPKINFRKIKLSKAQNITKIFLDDTLFKLDLPEAPAVQALEVKNPLRKKIDQEETIEQEVETKEEEVLLKKEEKKDVTFNLEAQIAHEEENVILSPAIVSLPPFKQDLLSTSGEQGNFVWPPLKQRKSKKSKKRLKQKQKPYFLPTFPWAQAEQEYEFLKSFEKIRGGLESELLDLPALEPIKQTVEPNKETAVPFLGQIALKALTPEIPSNLSLEKIDNIDSKDIKFDAPFVASKVDHGIELLGKGIEMFEKFRIIMIGGFTATLGYLIWSYYFPNIQMIPQPEKKKHEKVIVRDLFKEKHTYKKAIGLSKDKMLEPSKEEVFKPITENERISLIQKARESVETRLDPFGQEGVLPQSAIEQKIKEKEEEMKPPPDIPQERKQVELVGVISTNNKDLALVNLYSADYSVGLEDDKITKETKLKNALSMAVPNRIEVSLLDPVDDWYIKKITKGKGRNEDPSIELVKGDKKFKLRVGQKVLLPEDKPLDDTQEQADVGTDTKETNKDKTKTLTN